MDEKEKNKNKIIKVSDISQKSINVRKLKDYNLEDALEVLEEIKNLNLEGKIYPTQLFKKWQEKLKKK